MNYNSPVSELYHKDTLYKYPDSSELSPVSDNAYRDTLMRLFWTHTHYYVLAPYGYPLTYAIFYPLMDHCVYAILYFRLAKDIDTCDRLKRCTKTGSRVGVRTHRSCAIILPLIKFHIVLTISKCKDRPMYIYYIPSMYIPTIYSFIFSV